MSPILHYRKQGFCRGSGAHGEVSKTHGKSFDMSIPALRPAVCQLRKHVEHMWFIFVVRLRKGARQWCHALVPRCTANGTFVVRTTKVEEHDKFTFSGSASSIYSTCWCSFSLWRCMCMMQSVFALGIEGIGNWIQSASSYHHGCCPLMGVYFLMVRWIHGMRSASRPCDFGWVQHCHHAAPRNWIGGVTALCSRSNTRGNAHEVEKKRYSI